MMDYYHRRHQDGSCESICTRCFATLGRANDLAQLKYLEAVHQCARDLQTPSRSETIQFPGGNLVNPEISGNGLNSRLWHFLGELDGLHTFLLLCGIVVCSYILPTVIEFELLKYIGVWASCIVLGDLVGCSLLSIALGLRKTGSLLYAALMSGEILAYENHIVRPRTLVWLVDLVPTLAITAMVIFFFLKSRRLPAPAAV
jgi:hypothetical protein